MRPTTLLFWLLVLVLPWVWHFRRQLVARVAGSGAANPAGSSETSVAAGTEPSKSAALGKESALPETSVQLGEALLLAGAGKENEALALLDQILAGPTRGGTLTVDRELEVRMHRAAVLRRFTRYDEALAEYRLCQTKARLAPRNTWLLQAAFDEGALLIQLGQQQAGIQLLQSILDSRPAAKVPLQLDVLHRLAETYHASGDHARGLQLAEQGAALARNKALPLDRARLLRLAARCQMALGRPEEALATLQRTLDLYRLAGNATGQVAIKREIGRLYQATGEWPRAFSWLRACLEDEEATEDVGAEACLCYDIACLSIDQGALMEAGMFLQRSLSLFRQVDDRDGIDEAGRTMMGLTVLIHRVATADQMTFRDIERGVKSSGSDKE